MKARLIVLAIGLTMGWVGSSEYARLNRTALRQELAQEMGRNHQLTRACFDDLKNQFTPGYRSSAPLWRTENQQEIIVTAQKREENIQNVAASVQALGTTKLQQMHVQNFNDYIKFLPSVSYQSLGPGYSNVYMRGVAADNQSNHSGSLPSVGTYLDEQPITTVGGALDIHVYDIARVESLSGPQGTLYGASSEAGTIRIITNKPEIGVFNSDFWALLPFSS